MDAFYEKRTAKRIKYIATVMIEVRDTGIFHYATLNNFSGDGLFCGSDYALRPGTFITIRDDNPPFAAAPKIYLGEVLRCEDLLGNYDSHLYGLGIKINKAI
jgi:hypothetical protein